MFSLAWDVSAEKNAFTSQAPWSKVTMFNDLKVGMIVDAVCEVLRVPQESIVLPPDLATTMDIAFIIGIAKIAEHLMILLDVNKLLATDGILSSAT